MSDEIKEILDKAKEISGYGSDGKQHTRMFNQFEAKALLDYITNLQEENERLNNIINELERRFNQELELNNKWEVEDTQKFYSKKWYRDVLRDFKNMIKELKENKYEKRTIIERYRKFKRNEK